MILINTNVISGHPFNMHSQIDITVVYLSGGTWTENLNDGDGSRQRKQ